MVEAEAWQLYELMLRSRRFEEAVKKLWDAGKISGEMHLGIGEEAIIAGVVSQLKEGDAMALDHRGTPPLIMRGIDMVALLLEFLGHPQGLCAGMGGHMHLFSKEHLAASSGIVGSSGPAATGFALALRYNKSDNIAVALFGEGSMNQGMMLESMNLASVWKLPVLFVCKDNDWAITTLSKEVTGGTLVDRARGFGIEGAEVDGIDVAAVLKVAKYAISKMRKDGGPYFVHAHCVHKTGHFLGDPLLRFHETPMKMFDPSLMKSAFSIKGGAPFHVRGGSLVKIFSFVSKSGKQRKIDPLVVTEKKLKENKGRLKEIEETVSNEVEQAVRKALDIVQGRGEA
ncbi:MAG: thiamine pyrophosphate-dependent dehydrogenase E1 component subunit alpha [Halobacteriota archaeon]